MAKLKKGSAAAKAYMAKLRAAKGKKKTGRPAKMKVYAKPNAKGKLKVYGRKVGDADFNQINKFFDNLSKGSNELIQRNLKFEADMINGEPYVVARTPRRIVSKLHCPNYNFALKTAKMFNDKWKQLFSYQMNGVKKPKAKAKAKRTPISKHKDTNSHNVNIKVMSGFKTKNFDNITIVRNDIQDTYISSLSQANKRIIMLSHELEKAKKTPLKNRTATDKLLIRELPKLIKNEKSLVRLLKSYIK